MISQKTMLLFITLSISTALIVPATNAEYTDSCSLYAQMLWSAADEFESAKSDFESAKSSYESACSPSYGYSKDDESACGSYGYERTSYEGAKNELIEAKSNLEDALENVANFCGACDHIYGVVAKKLQNNERTIEKLNKKLEQKDMEIKRLKKQ